MPQHRHRNRNGQTITEDEYLMTQTSVVTEHNVVNPVSTDSDGNVVTDRADNPAVNVVVSYKNDGVSSDRETGATSSRVSDTWTAAEDVRSIIITAIGDDGVAANESCVVCFDAPDDATAVAWLAGNTTAGQPTMRKVITVGQPREFHFTNPLRRIDIIDLIGTVTNVFIEAN